MYRPNATQPEGRRHSLSQLHSLFLHRTHVAPSAFKSLAHHGSHLAGAKFDIPHLRGLEKDAKSNGTIADGELPTTNTHTQKMDKCKDLPQCGHAPKPGLWPRVLLWETPVPVLDKLQEPGQVLSGALTYIMPSNHGAGT